MSAELVYLDSSAIVKLVVMEPETPALLSFLARHPERTSSALARVEVSRALRRARVSAAQRRRADDVLARIGLIRIDDAILDRAADLQPADLRSLDAIHIAAALSIQDELAEVISYDDRFTAAAMKLRLKVIAPS